MTAIGYAVLPVTPSMRGMSKTLQKDFEGPAQAAAKRTGGVMGDVLKGAMKTAGLAAGAVLATSLTKGFQRLTAIENAEAKLKGLGNSAADTASIMDNALAAVKGTAFGMDEAATTAASAVAAGLKPGKDLQGYLGLVGDAATIAGTSMADMGGIFNKVMTSGKVQGDVFAQLGDKGIPVVQMLADKMGVSAEEVYKLGSAGKISSDQFLEAMSSMQGAALEGGNTTTGAYKNMMAALGRLGAGLLSGMFPHFKTAFAEMTGWIDGLEEKLTPLADVIGQKLGTALGAVVGWLQRLDFSSFSDFADSVGGSGVFDSIGDSLVKLRPALASIVESLPQVGSAAVQLGAGALQILAKGLSFLANNVDTIIKFMPALLAGYVAWRVASQALVASQVRLQLAQTMMAPVFLASNLLRWQAVRGELALAAAKGTSTTATTANTAAESGNILARGRAIAATVGQRIAMVATTVATWAATAATTALGIAIRIATGPIGLVIAGVAALAAGLVFFFTKTETGQRVWGAFMDKVRGAWDVLKNLGGAIADVWSILTKGDMTGGLSAFGIEEDSGLVDFLFRVRDAVTSVGTFLGEVVSFGKMVGDILFGGNFSGGAPFGLEEDSGLVDFLFTVRETVIGVGQAIKTAWESVIKPVLEFMGTALKVLAAVLMAALITPFIVGWNLLSATVQTIWQSVLQPVWSGMQIALGALGAAFQWVWTSLIQPAWTALGVGIAWVYQAIVQPIWSGMQFALGALGTFFQWVWTGVIQPAWNALGAGIAFVWNSVVRPTWDALRAALSVVGSAFQAAWNAVIKPVWDALGSGIRLVVDSVIRPAFDGIKSALQSVGDFFGTIVGGIQRVWDQLKGHVARPINFVIDTVWNNGLVRAWNTIAGFLPGLPRAATLAPVAFAEGGPVPFAFGAKRGKDSVHGLLMPDEHVWDVDNVARAGGHGAMYRMRNMVDQGKPFTWSPDGIFLPGHGVPRYANGGAVDDSPESGIRLSPTPGEGGLRPIAVLAKRLIHRIWPDITEIGGYRQDAYPEHPSGRALDVMVGVGNPAGDEVTGWALANDAILPLIHALWKQTVWMPGGGTQPMGDRGSPTQNHMDHPHLWYHEKAIDPNVVPDGLVGHDGLSSLDRRNIIRDKVQEIIDKAMDPVLERMGQAIGEPPPEWLGIPPEVATRTKDAAIDTAFDFVDNIGENLREVYDKAKGVTSFMATAVSGLWRDQGGFIPTGQSVVTNETGRPEAVFNWKQVDQFRRILESARDLDHLWEILDEFAHLATTGDYRGRMHGLTGLDEDHELIDAVLSMREMFHDGLGELQSTMDQVVQAAGVKARKGYESELLDFFGFKGLADSATAVWDAFNPAAGEASPGGGVTSAIGGAAGAATTDLTYGNPDLKFELQEIELETKMPDLNNGTPGSGAVKDQVKEAFAAYGWDKDPYWSATDWIVGKESTWDPMARNPSSGAFGLFQFLGGTKQQYLPDENPNPKIQGEAGAKYIKDRYGDPLKAKAFWEANGWYDRGGLAFGRGLMPKNTLSPERVLSPSQTAAFESWMASGAAASVIDASHWQSIDALLSSLPSAAEFQRIASLAEVSTVAVPATVAHVTPAPVLAPEGSGGGSVPLVHIENQYTMDADEAARSTMREARRASRSSALAGGWRG